MNYKYIENYEGLYSISDNGNVLIHERDHGGRYKRIYKEKFAKLINAKTGYLVVGLYKNGIAKQVRVHRLVAKAFVKNPKPILFNVVNHINANKKDNRAENLEWCSPKMNAVHTVKIGRQARGEKLARSKLKSNQVIEIRELYKTGMYSQRFLAKSYKVNQGTILSLLNNKTWTHI